MRFGATRDIFNSEYAAHRLALALSDTKQLFDGFAYRFAGVIQRIIPF